MLKALQHGRLWLVARPCTPAHARARLVYPDVAATQLLYWELNYVCPGVHVDYSCRPRGRQSPAWTPVGRPRHPPPVDQSRTYTFILCVPRFSALAPSIRPVAVQGPVTSPEGELRLSVVYASFSNYATSQIKSGSTTSLPVGPVPPPSHDLSIMFLNGFMKSSFQVVQAGHLRPLCQAAAYFGLCRVHHLQTCEKYLPKGARNHTTVEDLQRSNAGHCFKLSTILIHYVLNPECSQSQIRNGFMKSLLGRSSNWVTCDCFARRLRSLEYVVYIMHSRLKMFVKGARNHPTVEDLRHSHAGHVCKLPNSTTIFLE